MTEPSSPSMTLQTKGMLCDPGDHFRGRYEVESKFRVESLARVRTQLQSMEAVPFTLGNVETDIFLDEPGGRLASNDQQQVMRTMEPSGRVLWICKGPGPDRCVAMDLDGADKALEMLSALGFIETGRLAKHRDIYFAGDFHITLDRLDGLGSFVEIAVMTDDAGSLPDWAARIKAFAASMGLGESQKEARSYRAMLGTVSGANAGVPA